MSLQQPTKSKILFSNISNQSEVPIIKFGSLAVNNYDPKYAFVIERSRQQISDLKASVSSVFLRDSDFDSNLQSSRREKLHERSMRIAALSVPRLSKR